MISEKNLEKILRAVIKTGKVVIGTKEASRSIKGSKLVIYSSSLSKERISEVVDTCRSLSVPFTEFKGTSIDLGRICGKPFLISAISVKSSGEVDLSPLIEQA
ncbi:MAG: ribosomal L7Ae/L30e/S12e/Gadd45 family protein [archaeon]|nr:ribosomal L7Ae/L30e/S12e/Gadd45 family protein [archaeon]MCP8306961.1 ribosomal L7Ae/L30e/S12e/Gadd45 family protein [archaeon]